MRASESLPLAYFAGCAVVSWLRPLPRGRRVLISAISAACGAFVLAVAYASPAWIRDWAPGVSILVAYYLSGRFFVQASPSIEAWLTAWDRRLLGDPTTRFRNWPRAVLAYLEIVYMGCFLMVPAGCAVLAATGRGQLIDRYWTIVAAAELGAFAPLAVVQTRPPWAIERRPVLPDRAVHRAASHWVEHFTIGVNTFPSGHVAGSLAVALALLGPLPLVGGAALVLASSIAVATVVGRYHYVVDGVAGAALAVAVWAVVILAGI